MVGKWGRRGGIFTGACFKIASGTQSPHPPPLYFPKYIIITSSFTHFAHSATSLSFTYVSNLVPDSSLCRAAAPRLRPLQLLLPDCVRFSCCSPIASASAAAPRLRPHQLLLAVCVRFSCCSLIADGPFQLLLDCVCFNCCCPIASASAASPRLRPLQLLLPDCIHRLFWKIPADSQCS